MQNYGLEEGFPGTLYWKGIQAKYIMIEYMTKRLHRALQVEAQAGQESTSILSKFVACLKEEGYDVYENGTCTEYVPVSLPFQSSPNAAPLLCFLVQNCEYLYR